MLRDVTRVLAAHSLALLSLFVACEEIEVIEKSTCDSMRACRAELPTVMRAIRVSQFGSPDVLQLRENVVVPKPSVNEVLLKVYAAGVNPVETYIRRGNYAMLPNLPYTPGNDAAGVVTAVGSKVKNFKVGDRVFTRSCSGSYAEYTTALEDQVYKLHERLTFSHGASIGVPYRTAHVAIHSRAKARPAETVLVHGASGGVGVASVQLAVAHGMTVLGTAGSDEGMASVQKVGAHRVFNHSSEDYTEKIMEVTGGKGVDVILEMLANVNLAKDLKLLAVGGRVVVIGSRGDISITPRDLMARNSVVIGLGRMGEEEVSDAYSAIQSGIALGWITPVVGKVYPLEKAREAQIDVIEGKAKGKMVLTMTESS